MKNFLRISLVSLFSLIVLAGFSQDEMLVNSDQKLAGADFDNYSTFTFASHIEDVNNNQFFWENETMKSYVKKAVRAQLQALGYNYVEGPDASADLLVNFQILKEDIDFQGYNDVERVRQFWGTMVDAMDRNLEDRTTHELKKGTIMVHIADVEQGFEVWRGYASGIVEDVTLTDDNEVKILEAVSRIFNEYNFTASR
jgi:hypothetical protein